MQGYDPSRSDAGRDLSKTARHGLVRKPMKTVAPDALVVEALGQRIGVGDRRMAAMERRVEAADLHRFGEGAPGRRDAFEVVRLV